MKGVFVETFQHATVTKQPINESKGSVAFHYSTHFFQVRVRDAKRY
jgi:hypothetical protein